MEAQESYIGGYHNAPPITEFLQPNNIIADHKVTAGDPHFAVDCLLDDLVDDTLFINDGLTSNDSSNSSSLSSVGTVSCQFVAADSGDLCVPYDELAELEWLSNFVEDSFSFSSHHTLQSTLHIMSASETYTECVTRNNPTNLMFQPDAPLPGKARSKRPWAAPAGNWSIRLLPTNPKSHSKKEKNPNPSTHSDLDSTVRKCLHCAAEKTPQWRTGPMGPKTLCNACGVRYKSGRLVPEYRPAASPTFVPTKHSNSHRKVLELRRQKEMHGVVEQEQFLNQTSIFGVFNGGEDFVIHHHNSVPNFRQIS